MGEHGHDDIRSISNDSIDAATDSVCVRMLAPSPSISKYNFMIYFWHLIRINSRTLLVISEKKKIIRCPMDTMHSGSAALPIHLASNPIHMWSYSHETTGILATAFIVDRKRNNSCQNVSTIFEENQWSPGVAATCISTGISNTRCTHNWRNDDFIAINSGAFSVRNYLQWSPAECTWDDFAVLNVSAETNHASHFPIVWHIIGWIRQRNSSNKI